MSKSKPTRSGLEDIFATKMESSGLDQKIAEKLCLEVLTSVSAPEWLPGKGGGFLIPYFDLKGKMLEFARWRYLEAPKRTGFDALTNRKPLKYVQPPKSASDLYLPPLIDWRPIAKDKTSSILITEGELKAASATHLTPYPCIGIGGVWSWKSAARHQPHLPAFDLFEWDGRSVYIVYDSDAVTNPMVMQAENALAKMLLAKGAEPHIVRLPNPTDGTKLGLDDYLVQFGAERLEELLGDTQSWSSSQELHRLNEEVVYVRDPGLILRLDNLQRMAPHAFKDHAYSTRVYYEEVVTKKSTTLVAKSAPGEWLKWPARAEVSRVVYSPGDDRVTDAGELNVWPGWSTVPKPGDVSPWSRLLDFIFEGNINARTWFERWCAAPLKSPGVKMYSSSLIWGLKHGTGKSFIGYSLRKIYGKNFTEIKDEHLHNSHNEWAENKQFVMGDEITGSDNRAASNRMKSMITQQQLRLNPKYIPSYTVRDCINYYFTSNHPDAFFLEDDDRRYFIWEVIGTPMADAFYHKYEEWIGAPGVTGPGVEALFHHLLTLDMGNFDARAPALMTKAKSDMLSNNRSDLASWVRQLKDDPDSVLRMDRSVLKHTFWRSEDLLGLYDPEGKKRVSVNGVSRELTRQGFRKAANGYGVYTQSAGQVRVWALRNIEEADRMANVEIGEAYDRERGVVIKSRKTAVAEKRERDLRTRLAKLKRTTK